MDIRNIFLPMGFQQLKQRFRQTKQGGSAAMASSIGLCTRREIARFPAFHVAAFRHSNATPQQYVRGNPSHCQLCTPGAPDSYFTMETASVPKPPTLPAITLLTNKASHLVPKSADAALTESTPFELQAHLGNKLRGTRLKIRFATRVKGILTKLYY